MFLYPHSGFWRRLSNMSLLKMHSRRRESRLVPYPSSFGIAGLLAFRRTDLQNVISDAKDTCVSRWTLLREETVLDFTDNGLTVWERKSIALAQPVSENPEEARSEKIARI